MVKRTRTLHIVVAAVMLILSSGSKFGFATEGNGTGVNSTVPAPAYVPPVPPDYSPSPQQAPPPAPPYDVPPPARMVIPAPPPAPVYVAPPPAQVVLPAAPPQFVYIPELGYYVAMGLSYDMIYDGRAYYFYNNGYWYQTPYYGGPWVHVARRLLPPLLLKFSFREIHRYRDVEFRRYEREKGHYRGRLHRPEARR